VRVVLLATIAAVTAVSAATGAQAAATRATCALGSTTVKGHKAVAYCGPATATLEIGGRSYRFKSGTCLWAGSLVLTMGTQVNGVPDSAHNEGAPLLQLTGSSSLGAVSATSGTLHLGMSIVQITPHGHSSGTFKGREPIGDTRRFTGSYRC
jgi:hypothetical protein